MLKEIRTLVSSTGPSAASAAAITPTRRASAMFSQVAEDEYRRHSIPYNDSVDNRSGAFEHEQPFCLTNACAYLTPMLRDT